MLEDGTEIKVDEKVRKRDYGDILLEYYSSEEHQTLGWIEKDLTCNYIAYVVLASRKCYLLDFQLLKRAWRRNREVWIEKYGPIRVPNNGYTTVCVAVPKKVIQEALLKAMGVTWSESIDLP